MGSVAPSSGRGHQNHHGKQGQPCRGRALVGAHGAGDAAVADGGPEDLAAAAPAATAGRRSRRRSEAGPRGQAPSCSVYAPACCSSDDI